MVAKSYQSLPLQGEPFIENGKAYVFVIQNNKTTKKVRWYSDKEYAKMYPNEIASFAPSQRLILGFKEGYITIFPKASAEDPFFNLNPQFRYCRFWGWYCVSTENYPTPPTGKEGKRLPWELVGLGETLLPPETIKKNLKENGYV